MLLFGLHLTLCCVNIYSMAEKKFYIRRYKKKDGAYVALDEKDTSLEDDYGFIRYKSMTGLNAVGKQKGVYVEAYPESNSARVYIADKATREQTSSTLSLYVFGCNPELPVSASVTEQIAVMNNTWVDFFDRMEGCLILWHDDYRQRKPLFYITDAVEPKSDVIKNLPYLQCDIKLTNVFGKTFSMNDTTIEKWLENKGKEATSE